MEFMKLETSIKFKLPRVSCELTDAEKACIESAKQKIMRQLRGELYGYGYVPYIPGYTESHWRKLGVILSRTFGH